MKTRLLQLSVMIISVLLSLVVAEIVIRIFWPQKTETDYSPGFTYHCFMPGTYYWVALLPNSDCPLSSIAHDFTNIPIQTNEMGLRNGPITIPKPKDTLRILVIGDSFAMGWGVKEEEAFPRVVEALLKKRYPTKHIEVINGGVASTGPGRHYLFLKHEGMTLEPDIVIVALYPYNDFATDMVFNTWDTTDANGLPEKISSTIMFVDSTGQVREKAQPLKLSIPWLRFSHVWAAIADTIAPPKYLYLPDTKVHALLCLYDEHCKELAPVKEQFAHLMDGMQDLTKKIGAQLVLVNIPPEFAIDESKSLKYGISKPLTQMDLRAPRRDIIQVATQRSIPYIPLRETLFAHYLEGLWFVHDDHWTARGHAVVAQTITDGLVPIIEAMPR